ncbi:hypothetical protein VNO77_22513 [Canavalia gladiata]|uniref:Uncharacterized protein n=1 Tax=Canavalia gladiata TaxID=3824 RepID=A0AAN9L5Z8_CANGL
MEANYRPDCSKHNTFSQTEKTLWYLVPIPTSSLFPSHTHVLVHCTVEYTYTITHTIISNIARSDRDDSSLFYVMPEAVPDSYSTLSSNTSWSYIIQGSLSVNFLTHPFPSFSFSFSFSPSFSSHLLFTPNSNPFP